MPYIVLLKGEEVQKNLRRHTAAWHGSQEHSWATNTDAGQNREEESDPGGSSSSLAS